MLARTIVSTLFVVFLSIDFNNAGRCFMNEECLSSEICQNAECVDPCVTGLVNVDCEKGILDDIPTCTCKPGYYGDPFSTCARPSVTGPGPRMKNVIFSKEEDTYFFMGELCATHATCGVGNHIPGCKCDSGYGIHSTGDSFSHCYALHSYEYTSGYSYSSSRSYGYTWLWLILVPLKLVIWFCYCLRCNSRRKAIAAQGLIHNEEAPDVTPPVQNPAQNVDSPPPSYENSTQNIA